MVRTHGLYPCNPGSIPGEQTIYIKMTEITSERYRLSLNACNKDKHKIRENKFGVSFCTRCGRLFTSQGNKALEENDKLLIKQEG